LICSDITSPQSERIKFCSYSSDHQSERIVIVNNLIIDLYSTIALSGCNFRDAGGR